MSIFRFGDAGSSCCVNLLDIPAPAVSAKSVAYWSALWTLIVVHGGFLVYLTVFSRSPDFGTQGKGSGIITLQLARANADGALAKADREYSRHSQSSSAPFDEALPNPVVPSTLALLHVRDEAALPEDMALEALLPDYGFAKRTDGGKLRGYAGLSGSRHQGPWEGRIRVAELHWAGELYSRVGVTEPENARWPEDAGRGPSSDRLSNPTADVEATYGAGPDLQPQTQQPLPPLTVPIPARRDLPADEIAFYDADSLSLADFERDNYERASMRSPPPAGHARHAYRAKVRAHLAANKPIGGLGSGMVVVSFTLSRSGSVRAVRVLNSSGDDDVDERALAAIRRAEPYPNAPKGVGKADLRFAVPFHFQ